MATETTTLRVETKLKDELDRFKNFSRESYSDIIRRLVNIAKDPDSLEENEIQQIQKSIEDIKNGRILSLKEAEKKWGI
jgi:predicted CopG family antitoxin